MREDAFGKIIYSLENEPDRWESGSYTFVRDDKLSIWTDNGFMCLKIYSPDKMKFSFFQKLRINYAIKNCKANKILSMAEAVNE